MMLVMLTGCVCELGWCGGGGKLRGSDVHRSRVAVDAV